MLQAKTPVAVQTVFEELSLELPIMIGTITDASGRPIRADTEAELYTLL